MIEFHHVITKDRQNPRNHNNLAGGSSDFVTSDNTVKLGKFLILPFDISNSFFIIIVTDQK